MSFPRIIAGDRNRLVQGCGTLMGMAAGLMADRRLNDEEVRFLGDWLKDNEELSAVWPGDILYERVKSVLADEVISESERQHLVDTLAKICGGSLERLGERGAVNQLAFDEPPEVRHQGFAFCVTGEFVYGPRERVVSTITSRGGVVQGAITKKLNYLVVGLRGSEEWKHGSYGTKMEKAIAYKRDGVPIIILREDTWSSALKAA